MPCTPFQDGASSLATSPRGSEMQCSSGHSPTPLAWPTGAKYYHQRWAHAGGGGVLRYVLVLNAQQKQEDNQAPILISARQRGGCAGEGPKYDDEGARRQGRTRHTPEREVTSQPPSSSTLGYYSALQPGMCWCGHGRDSVGPIHHPPALPQHTPTPPGENPGSPCPTRHPNPPYTQLWSVTSHPPSSPRRSARVGLVLPRARRPPLLVPVRIR